MAHFYRSYLEHRIGRPEVIDPIFGQLFVHSCSLSVGRRALRLEHLMVERLKWGKLTRRMRPDAMVLELRRTSEVVHAEASLLTSTV